MSEAPLQKRSVISGFVVIVLSLLVGWSTLSRPVSGTLSWDVTGYYFYLPALFIYDDIALEDRAWMEDLRVRYDLSGTLYQFHPLRDGSGHVDQYTCGMAILYLPAFAAGHWMAPLLGDPQDGFSRSYQLAITGWSLLIAVAGLFSLWRLLLLFFTDRLSALVLVITVTGTNYLVQVSGGIATPHNYLFFLYAFFFLNVVLWHRHRGRRYWFGMAIPLGLACLIRPTEIIAIILPLTWDTSGMTAVATKLRDLWVQQRRLVYSFAAVLLVCALPQMVYWWAVAGRPLYMSYANPGEGFDFLRPHTLNFLFSFRKGWLIYTPLILLVIPGFVWIYRNRKGWFTPLLVFFLLNLYIVSSWSTWWYAQCFSQRAMVHTLPVTAVIIGAAILWLNANWTRRLLGGSAVLALYALTLFFIWQYREGIIDQWRMTGPYFRKIFLKTSVDPADKDLLLIDRSFTSERAFRDRDRYHLYDSYRYSEAHPDEADSLWKDTLVAFPVKVMKPGSEFTRALRREFRWVTAKDHAWMTVSAEVWLPDGVRPDDMLLVGLTEHKGGVYEYRTAAVPADSLSPGEWNTIWLDYLTPEVRSRKDEIVFYLWYRGTQPALAREINVQAWERND